MIAGIYTRGEPTANQQFRENTANRAQMLNADLHPPLTLCSCCGVRRNTKTGKTKKSGAFVCNGCGRARAMSAA